VLVWFARPWIRSPQGDDLDGSNQPGPDEPGHMWTPSDKPAFEL
jgi:hypothetical protein